VARGKKTPADMSFHMCEGGAELEIRLPFDSRGTERYISSGLCIRPVRQHKGMIVSNLRTRDQYIWMRVTDCPPGHDTACSLSWRPY